MGGRILEVWGMGMLSFYRLLERGEMEGFEERLRT